MVTSSRSTSQTTSQYTPAFDQISPRQRQALVALLKPAGISINGPQPWDIQLNDPQALSRIVREGSLGLGESYMEGQWSCERLDILFERALRAGLDHRLQRLGWQQWLLQTLANPQSILRSRQVGLAHYDLGNRFFASMLDSRMTYTCGYWLRARNLEEAQLAKLDLICRKLGLQPGMRLLDIGCGWGSLMRYAAERYGVECVGLTISKEQAEYGSQLMGDLPVRFEFADYREYQPSRAQSFDRIASVGMFEHVGHKNYEAYFNTVSRCLKPDGLCLLHTIGKNRPAAGTDPWINRYIFPNGEIPALSQIMPAIDGRFVVEDLHNFGCDYDHTLMAWHENFEQHWPQLKSRYDERFYRMWRYYLLSCAGAFRARSLQLWQLVLSPHGVEQGYRRHN
ncbi:MAG: cyclopropane fatty acyl phospholipid synthase [Xanthomonadales bacterium]|nr:cyclopropane fatty acyl phospholipid synthase [Xanthomonadales bacterium]